MVGETCLLRRRLTGHPLWLQLLCKVRNDLQQQLHINARQLGRVWALERKKLLAHFAIVLNDAQVLRDERG